MSQLKQNVFAKLKQPQKKMEQEFLRMLLEGRTDVTARIVVEDSTSSEFCFKALKKAFKVRELSSRGRLEYFTQAVNSVKTAYPGWDGTEERIEELETLLQASRQICQSTSFAEIQDVLAAKFKIGWIYSTMASRSLATRALQQIARTRLFEIAVQQ